MLRSCIFPVGVKKANVGTLRILDRENIECTDYHEVLSLLFCSCTTANIATKAFVNVSHEMLAAEDAAPG